MDLSKNEVARAYSPFRKEALFCFIVDVVILLICSAVFVVIELQKYAIWLFLVFPLYFLAEVFINYRIAILSLIEDRHQCIVFRTVVIEHVQIESSASGHWGSVLPSLYPSQMRVQRYKIKCTDANGKKLSLRCAMSIRNAKLFDKMLESPSLRKRTVVTGKFSHIILKYCDKDDFAFVLSRRL